MFSVLLHTWSQNKSLWYVFFLVTDHVQEHSMLCSFSVSLLPLLQLLSNIWETGSFGQKWSRNFNGVTCQLTHDLFCWCLFCLHNDLHAQSQKWHKIEGCCIWFYCSWFVCVQTDCFFSLAFCFSRGCFFLFSVNQLLIHFTRDRDHKALKAFWIKQSLLKTHQLISSSS